MKAGLLRSPLSLRIAPTVIAGLVLVVSIGHAQENPAGTARSYSSPYGTRIVISHAKRRATTRESLITFYSSKGQKLCSADYSSEDGEHGYGVAKAAWTPDGRYFVYSLESSGGHSVMNTPTEFFSRDARQVCSLDAFVGGNGIEFADFQLSPPDTVELTVNAVAKPVRVSLGSIMNRSDKLWMQHCVPCTEGKVHKFGDSIK
jgi:hypothetical protein